MKRLAFILALLVCSVSCLKPESERVPEVLQITSRTTGNLAPFGAQIWISVKCDLHWKAELEDPSWGRVEVQSLSEGKGGEFVVVLKDNLGEEDRTNAIIVKAGKGETKLDIVQSGLSSFFKPRSIQLEGTREASVVFTAPAKWSAVLPENPDWVKLTSASGESGYSRMACRANDENENLGSRETIARLTFGDYSFDIPVVQVQKDVILMEDTSVDIDYSEQELSVVTQFNIDYEVEISAPWITRITTKAPLNEGVERFAIEENTSTESRNAAIGFKGGKATPVILMVEQGGKDRILNFTQQGIYDLEGKDYVWGEKGWDQRSLLFCTDGSYRLRLLNAEQLSIVEVSGIRFDYPSGEQQPMLLRVRDKAYTTVLKDCSVTLLKQDEGLYWFKDASGVGFIIKK